MSKQSPIHTEFCELLEELGNIADLSRRSGLSRRIFELKRDGERRVRYYDVWALRAALDEKREREK